MGVRQHNENLLSPKLASKTARHVHRASGKGNVETA